MEVLAYRLTNGDEILGRGFNPGSESDHIVLEKVRHVVVQRVAEGLSIVLMPWTFSNVDTQVTLMKSHIVAEFEPSAESISSYLQQTTGIALTSA